MGDEPLWADTGPCPRGGQSRPADPGPEAQPQVHAEGSPATLHGSGRLRRLREQGAQQGHGLQHLVGVLVIHASL